jgi:hypothetical protein
MSGQCNALSLAATIRVIGGDNPLDVRHKISWPLCWLDGNRCGIGRCVNIDLHGQAPA